MDTISNKSNSNSFAICSVVLLLVISIGRITELVPLLGSFKLGKITLIFALLAILTANNSRFNVPLMSIALVRYVIGLTALIVLSVPSSVWPGQSVDFILNIYIKNLIVFFLIIKIVHDEDALLKIIDGFSISIFCLGILVVVKGTESYNRVFAGETFDPNDLAFVMVVGLPIIYFMFINNRGIRKIFLGITLFLSLLTIIKSVSRGGFIGLLVVSVLILFKDKSTRMLTKFTIIGICIALFVGFASSSYWERMSTINTYESDYNTTSESGRIAIWKRGLVLIFNNPVIGVGAGSFSSADGQAGGRYQTAHNSLIQVGGELGLGGLIIFLMLLIKSLHLLRNLQAGTIVIALNENNRWIPVALEVSFYGYLSAGFFLSQGYSIMLFYLLSNCVILQKIIDSKRYCSLYKDSFT